MVAYSFQKRFVPNIRVGLKMPPYRDSDQVHLPEHVVPWRFTMPSERKLVTPPQKRQTIRAIGKRRHARPGEIIQLYCGMRTKHCFKIGEARCMSASQIYFDFRMGLLQIEREGHKHIRARAEFDDFARKDGFSDWDDMRAFWEKEHNAVNFAGILIEWKPL